MSYEKNLEDATLPDVIQELRLRATPDKSRAATHLTVISLRLDVPAAERPLIDVPSDKLITRMFSMEKAIYGMDDRMEAYEVAVEAHKKNMDCVVALVKATNVKAVSGDRSTLLTKNFGSYFNLCATERYREQPLAADCSGFLVHPNVIATAAHCVESEVDLKGIRFVFGFRMISGDEAQLNIANADIYTGRRIIERVLSPGAADWALIELDRPVRNHSIAKLRRTGSITEGSSLHVIGHPCGLPLKFAGGSRTVVRDATPPSFFVANLDTYGGNSGSPVFNNQTHEVEGILVRGEADFVQAGNCQISKICPNTGCRGEDCTKVTEFAALVPKLAS